MYLFRHPAFDPSNCLSTYLSFSHLFSVFCLPTSPPIFSVTKLWIYLHSHWSIFISFHFSIGLLISLSPICLSIYSSLNHILSFSHSFIFFFCEPTYLAVFPSVQSSIIPSIYSSSYYFSCPSVCWFIFLSIQSPIHQSTFYPFCLQIQSSIYLLTHPSIFSSFQLSICIPTVKSGA